MKKKNIIISIACSIFFIICVGAAIILFPKVKEETIAYSTSIEDLFEKEGHFYVYFNRKECPYCDNIEDDIKHLKKRMRFMRLMQKHVKELGIMIGIPMKRNTMSKLEKKTVPEKLYFTMD